jgi:hypothetical protein
MDGGRELSEQSFPIHRAKVNQGSTPQATFHPPCKSFRTARFEFFDLTGWRRRSESGAARHIFYTFGRIFLRIQTSSIISNCIEIKPFGIRFGIRCSG